jgi:glycine cleavage system H protein
MSQTPAELYYAASHEWSRLDDDGIVTVGISDFAQEALGDVVYVELPELEAEFVAGEEIAVVESVKAASDIYAPVAGTVVAVNGNLEDAPETVNQDPYGNGWFFKLKPLDAGQLDDLLSAEAYDAQCESEGAG